MGLIKRKPVVEKVKPIYICVDCGAMLARKSTRCPDCAKERNRTRTRERANTKHKAMAKQFTCKECGIMFTPEYGVKRRVFHSDECADKYAHKAQLSSEARKECKRRRRARKVNAFVSRVNTNDIFLRDHGRCQLCGKKIRRELKHPHPMSLTIDHIIPLSKGGTHEPKNVQIAHMICNSTKSDGSMHEQLRLC
jgi:5-methylcytosine-specific restriction endonuclease McrA